MHRVLQHDCLLGDEARVSKGHAIEYYGFHEDDFTV